MWMNLSGGWPLTAGLVVAGLAEGKATLYGVTAGNGQRPKKVLQNNVEVCEPMDICRISCAKIGPSRATAPSQTSSSSAW